MSYDLVKVNKVDCPCGKGKIVLKMYENDWNQEQNETEIECSECAKKYKITTKYVRPRKGHEATYYYATPLDGGESIFLQL